MKKIISMLLVSTMLLTGCGSKDKTNAKDAVTDITITNLVNDPNLIDMHNLDEVLDKLVYTETGESFATIEKNYYDALQENNGKKAELMVSKMIKMVICAKLSAFTKYDAQTILDNIEFPSIGKFNIDNESGAFIKVKDLKVMIALTDNDQFQRLVLNYLNSTLKVKGYDRPYSAATRYEALKEAILTSEKTKNVKPLFDEPYMSIESDFDKEKIKALK